MILPLLSSVLYGSMVAAAPTSLGGLGARAPPSAKDVIIQMFQWNWDSIAAECTNFIGPAGYGYVQVSPPAEHVRGDEWWVDYQPVSYIINSRRGNRDQFSNMVQKCQAAGVGILVDAVWNHMSGQETAGQGWANSAYSHYNYPGIYGSNDFHYCGTSNGDIQSWTDRFQVQNCELVNLSDLKTESDYVRGRIAAYANDLLSLGVAGFRVDAAKHMPAADLQNIISRLSRSAYFTHEVISEGSDVINSNEYLIVGDVQEFRYNNALKDAFTGGNIASLRDLNSRSGWLPSQNANVFVANHDRERTAGYLTYKSTQNIYTLAHVFSLSYPYGTPSVLSSYQFSNNDQGPPNGSAGTCSGNGGTNGWNCQHRWLAISGMVGFFNTVAGTGLETWIQGSTSQIAFSRGSAGFVAINNGDSQWSGSFDTKLPNGYYCDVVGGKANSGTCTGATYTVSAGKVQNLVVQARSAVALHIEAVANSGGGGGGQIGTTFKFTATTAYGENIFVVGSLPALGEWNPDLAVPLITTSSTYPSWISSAIMLPPSTGFNYKLIRKGTGSVVWERASAGNRAATTPASGTLELTGQWEN